MRAEHIETLVSVGRPAVARDGSFAVFATSRPSIEANRPVGRLFRIELADHRMRPLTRGVSDSAPLLSPDDTRLAFLRADAKGKPQVWVVEASGGEPVQVTDAPLGVRSFDWSPDGTRLAFTAPVPEPGRYGSVEGLDAQAEAPRRVTGLRWQANGLGWTTGRPAQVFVVDAPDLGAEPLVDPAPVVRSAGESAPDKRVVHREAVQLTDGTRSFSGSVFAPGGTEILTVPDEPDSSERDLSNVLLAIRVDGSGEREVIGRDRRLSLSGVAIADDETIALLAAELPESATDFIAPGQALWILVDGVPQRLTDPETIDLGEVGSHITAIGEDFLVQNRTRGRVELLRVSRSGAVEQVLGGDLEVNGHGASEDGRILASVARPDTFGELVEVGGDTLTDFGAALRDTGVVVPEEREITGRDGYPVHGWVAKPEGDGPFPVILQIHGGPYAQYGVHAFDETQVLVDAGYAVVYCNPADRRAMGASTAAASAGPWAPWISTTSSTFSRASSPSTPRWTATGSASWAAPTAAI
ncbi:S9 family peptidase [Microbacterium sp. NIBRBAC000506063]|uniref:S9 family peptidase n=1 Tax=Microbacterium sp. NIBRBAC000506063 TaxID=2734618 RepID=UPI002948C32B|nr:S9 family peptidase [Microbacterium sp. NIBRBAC000506063]